jgi:hypothetical protein
MAELNDDYPTLHDLRRMENPDGTVATVAPTLTKRNPILGHIPLKECNDGRSEQTTVELSLPAVYLRSYNEVVADSKGTHAQVRDGLGMLEKWTRVDADSADHSGDPAGHRAEMERQTYAALSNEWANLLFYGNASATPKEFTGLSIRYSSPTGAANSRNTLDAGGSGNDCASIWMINWNGGMSVRGLVPKGSKTMGIGRRDFGRVAAETHGGQTGNIEVFKAKNFIHTGLAVKKWDDIARIGSIDVTELRNRSSAEADLIDYLIGGMMALDNPEGAKIYMNRTLYAYYYRQAREGVAAGGGLTFDNFEGKRRLHFSEMPIFICDALTNTEAAI